MDKQKNQLIVFCGMDGSGKTTLTKKVASYLKTCGLEYKIIHSHGYSISENSFGLSIKKLNKLKYLLRFLIPFALIDNLFTFYFRYGPVLKEKTLICDRYFYDKLARMIYYGISTNTIAKIYLKLLPKPDFTFFLDTAAQDAHIRKGEYQEEELLRYKYIYKFLAKHLNALVIDTSQSIDTSYKEIVELLQVQR